MNKKKIIDLVVLLLIGAFMFIGIFDHFSNNYVLSLNFYLGCAGLFAIILLKIYSPNSNYLVFWFLLLLAFNILVCSGSIVSLGSVNYLYNDGKWSIASVGVNPLFSIIFITYSLLNYDLVRKLFKESNKAGIEKCDVAVCFYYDKFNVLTADELLDIFKMYNEYPDEAKMALKKIHKEKSLSYIDFRD